MNLLDGLEHYKKFDGHHEIPKLEAIAKNLLNQIHVYGSSPPQEILTEARHFIIDVEAWKANHVKERMSHAEQNEMGTIWNSLCEACSATNDMSQLLAVMKLKGFGRSIDPKTGCRRTKLATALLRFLWPEKWGIIDWRNATLIGLLKKHHWDIDHVLIEAKRFPIAALKEDYNLIGYIDTCAFNKTYRDISASTPNLPQAADVDMAIFGLSLLIWPMNAIE